MEPKLCLHCGLPMENKRRSRHPECLPLAKAAARDALRRCSRCKQVKQPSAFSDDSSRADGKFPWCVACQGEYATAHRFQDSDAEPNGHICPVCDTVCRGHANRRFCSMKCKDKAISLRKKFSLSVEQFRSLVASTGGRCPICQHRVTQWHVDHDHKTGLTTGVVCAACNVGALAYSYHDIEYAKRLLAYLEMTPASTLGIIAIAPPGSANTPQLHRIWGHGGRKFSKAPRIGDIAEAAGNESDG